ncbi:hypothetical protein [Oxalicibacterium solurbis]|uniref:Uncharacterized protein n=1 Tax=Oxalicibacterium solurbis TaxID=69280 RepID=A0A8J3FAE4_9BURK|nr:hypothetical protein [Oxalicibacterium solurbis]GGI55653.1 hypothetical protein GCM10011430_28270 [Oxalicibacterium solurbis]
MPFLIKSQADTLLRPFFNDFEQIMRAAWQDWRDNRLAAQMQHKRVRAAIVWNQMLAHAKRQFDGREDVTVDTVKEWEGILIDGRIFIRMKKGTDKLLSRNFPTQTALAFHDQDQDLFGGIVRLELLYVLNTAETDIERIVLIQRHKKQIVWSIDLLDEADDRHNVQPLIPLEPAPETGSVADRIIKPKTDQIDKKQYGSSGVDS